MCCGKNRAAAQAAATSGAADRRAASYPAPAPLPSTATSEIVFEFVGHAATNVRGPVSGRVYRFSAPGDRLRVDPRDRPGLAAMPALRWVR
jgi:hypothetical protein